MLLAGAAALALATASRATVITFDDLADGTAVTDQYAGLGVLVDGGVIIEWTGSAVPSPVVSLPNVLSDLAGPGLVLRFVGALPNTVSLYVTAIFEDRVFLEAFDPAGLLADTEQTEGWAGPLSEQNSTPAVPR